jgi:RNA polymerase sigma factor (sigma-70 family)
VGGTVARERDPVIVRGEPVQRAAARIDFAAMCERPDPPDEPSVPPPRPPVQRPLSSTLHHVQNVQGEIDVDVSWANLHGKIQKWIEDAMRGQNLPPDKTLDDLAQDVLLQICKDIGEFKVEPGASFSGWVKMVANRKLNDIWRRARAQKRGGGKQRHLGDFDDSGGREHFADERTPRQSMLVRYQELSDSVLQALQQLSDKHKRVIELRMFQGKPFAEIMPELGYTKEVTVRSLYMRAVQRLQELLGGFTD